MPSKDRHIVLEPKSKTFYFSFQYKPEVVESIKSISGISWDAKGKIWKVKRVDSTVAKQILDFAEEHEFTYDGDELEYLESLIQVGAQSYIRSLAGKSEFKVQGLKREPYSYQRGGIEFCINNRKVILGDDMGLGKTLQALGVVAHLQLYPCLIVCPAVLKLNWQYEILQTIEGITEEDIQILDGGKPTGFTPKKFTILNYDILAHRWRDLDRPWAAIILDEVHYAKNPKSKRGAACRSLAKKSSYLIGISGTPIINRPSELINILASIGRLTDLGGKNYYEYRYCGAHRNDYGRWDTTGASNLYELNTRLRSNGILIRRSKQSVLPYLPKKIRQVVPFELDNRNEYEKAEADLARWLADQAIQSELFRSSLVNLSPNERINRIRSFHNSVEYKARATEQLRRFTALQQLSTKGKLEDIKRWVEDFLESDQKLVIFAKFVDTQHYLLDEFLWANPARVFAEDSSAQRQSYIDKFQQKKDCRLFVGSLKAAGVGITLTAASHVAFVEVGWSPGEMDQAEDRLHRIGQEFPVNVYYLVAPNTMDSELIDIIDRKRGVVTAATDGTDVSETGVMNALVSRLVAKYQGEKLI